MKKIVSVFLSVLVLFSAMALTSSALSEEKDMVINREYCVAVGEGSGLDEAAKTLAGYIRDITGEVLQVKTGFSAPCIFVDVDGGKVENGFLLETDESNVYIYGSTVHQAVRGIYYFIENCGGIKCYTSKLKVFEKSEVSIPKNYSFTYHPCFEYRETDWLSPCDVEYSLFRGLNGDDYRHITAEFGGTVDYISSFAHSLTNQFCSSDKYYEEHPEYFAKYRGIRTKDQLCLSNEDVYEIVRDEVFELLKEKHDPSADLQIVSLTQNDNIFFCSCGKCRAIDKKYGSHAGTMIEFVNRIARDVKAAGYDNVALDTFAYRYTRTPPVGIVPEDNVIVRLCSIECCFSHPLDDPSCAANADFMKDLEGWGKICGRVYVWDYTTNYSHFVGLFPDFGTLQRNMQVFYENNVKGVYEEGNFSMTCDTEFGELRAYLIAKLMQDPYLDYETTRNEFLDAYYGAGGKYIAEFLDIITESASEKHLGIYESMQNTLSLSNDEIKKCDELWKKAIAESDGDAKENALHSELSWRYWKMKNGKSEFASLLSRASEKQKLTDDINATGVRWREATEIMSFLSGIWQKLSQSIYPLVRFVLRILYSI